MLNPTEGRIDYIADGFARIVAGITYTDASPEVKEVKIEAIKTKFALHLRNVAAGLDAPPAPRAAAAVGLPGLEGGSESTLNAGIPFTGSSRRRLYSGLRKRGGTSPDSQLG